MELTKTKSITVVLEAFAVLEIFHFIGGNYLAAILVEMYPDFPWATASTVLSSDLSPVIAIIYLFLRISYFPYLTLDRNTLIAVVAGIIMAWLVVVVQTLSLGKEIPLAQETLKENPPYVYIELFSLMIWGPMLEETLARGYFFEILRKSWNNVVALLISSSLFVLSHGMWGDFGWDLVFIFLESVVFTLVYTQGGLIPAIMTHMFVNSYLLYLNMNL